MNKKYEKSDWKNQEKKGLAGADCSDGGEVSKARRTEKERDRIGAAEAGGRGVGMAVRGVAAAASFKNSRGCVTVAPCKCTFPCDSAVNNGVREAGTQAKVTGISNWLRCKDEDDQPARSLSCLHTTKHTISP